MIDELTLWGYEQSCTGAIEVSPPVAHIAAGKYYGEPDGVKFDTLDDALKWRDVDRYVRRIHWKPT